MEKNIQEYIVRVRKIFREYKKQSGKSTSMIAEDIPLHHYTMIKFERGYGMTRWETVERIEEYLNKRKEESE